jgi:hypothetical protein
MRRPSSLLHPTLHGPLGTLPPSTRRSLWVVGLAMIAILAVLLTTYAVTPLLRPTAASVPLTVLETQVPTRPVATLDRIDLGARIANTGSTRTDNVTVEMTLIDPSGNVAMRSRQTGIGLDARETRAVRWAWRVPAQAQTGTYTARVVVTNADGSRLASSDSRPASFVVAEER